MTVSASSRICLTLILPALLWVLIDPALAQTNAPCPRPAADIVEAVGFVELKAASSDVYMRTSVNTPICPGDTIRVGPLSQAAIHLRESNEVLRLDQRTTLQILEPPGGGKLIDLITGAIYVSWKRLIRTALGIVPGLEIQTPFVNGRITGTEFLVRVDQDRTLVTVFEGLLRLTNEQGSLTLTSNQSAVTLAGQAPQLRVVVRPRDEVQWTMYYQPILAPLMDPSLPETDQTRGIKESLEMVRLGDIAEAFDRLNRLPEADRGDTFYVYRASLFLGIGRVEEAQSDIDRALELAPDSGVAYALRAVIAVAHNDREQALLNGRTAVEKSPGSSAAKIALSYALQANFEIQEARDMLLQAIEDQPNDSLAWARLAELELSLGNLDRALEAAQTAISLGPNVSRAHTVLGFARLAQIKISDAKASFEKSLSIDPGSPLAHLGLGLARIRDGNLAEGRQDIEMAAALDPVDSLIRSYLGKAYFEERRDSQADEQFNLAKDLDPLDPTPYFYDAIRKQTVNRPVEALRDLQKSIELNDNRAVYRSRLLMDEDLAARSASLGRIYRDLGFEQIALLEGWRSTIADPGDYSGHRFLADTYSALPRHETARVSELLQSQLLQPINITPIQPTLGETSLYVLPGSGPADQAFNEFTPLFNRDRFALQASGVIGTQGILGDEVVHSGILGRFSYSIGQFHYQTDGFRKNNDQDQDIYNLFVQTSLSHKTGIQAEFRSRDLINGDLDLRFDPENFSLSKRWDEDFRSIRFGLHHVFSPNSEFITSVIYGSMNDQMEDSGLNDFGMPEKSKIQVDDSGWTAEIQHLYRSNRFRLVSGLGYFQANSEEVLDIEQSIPVPPFSLQTHRVDKKVIRQTNLYAYSLFDCSGNITFTLGASADFFDDDTSTVNQFNPKFGITWKPRPDTTVRAALLRTLHRALVSNQTIEPTNVAGFNQLFSGIMGEAAWRYGLGLDHKFSASHYAGIEISRRDLNVPAEVIPPEPAPFEFKLVRADWEEELGRGYFYWTPRQSVAVSAEYLYERFRRYDDVFGTQSIALLNTHRVPVGIGYFNSSGAFAQLEASYVHQDGQFPIRTGWRMDEYLLMPGQDQFGIVDIGIGYRLPKRYGIITLEAKNLFDKKFRFQNMDPARPVIAPERLILLRLTANF